jgi:hypothetical protein
VATYTLAMEGPVESRPQKGGRVEGLTMATLAKGRLLADRTVMVTTLANHVLVTVETGGEPAFADVLHQFVDDLSVRHDGGPELVEHDKGPIAIA